MAFAAHNGVEHTCLQASRRSWLLGLVTDFLSCMKLEGSTMVTSPSQVWLNTLSQRSTGNTYISCWHLQPGHPHCSGGCCEEPSAFTSHTS